MRRVLSNRPILCLVTDRQRLTGTRDPNQSLDHLIRQIADAAHAGVDLIHVRERDLPDRILMDLVARLVHAVSGTRASVVVNDRLDIALSAGAAGVHLRADSLPPARVRAILPPGFLIGRSVHDPAEARELGRASCVDYLVLGTVFPTSSKPGVALGPPALAAAVRSVDVPILAIGGITVETAHAVARAGAAGIAAIGLFIPTPRGPALSEIVERLRQVFDTSGGVV